MHFKLRPASGAGPAGSIDLGEQVDVNLNLATNRHNKKAGSGQYFRVCSIKRRHLFRASRCQDRNPGASFAGRRPIKNYKRLQFFFFTFGLIQEQLTSWKFLRAHRPPKASRSDQLDVSWGKRKKLIKGRSQRECWLYKLWIKLHDRMKDFGPFWTVEDGVQIERLMFGTGLRERSNNKLSGLLDFITWGTLFKLRWFSYGRGKLSGLKDRRSASLCGLRSVGNNFLGWQDHQDTPYFWDKLKFEGSQIITGLDLCRRK